MKILTVLLGTIIGAGFISGAEINLFFNSIGIFGLFGVIISSIILGLTIYFSLTNNNKSYNELIRSNLNNKILKFILLGMINIFLIISYFIMIAGLSSFFSESINIDYFISSIISILIIFIIVNGDINRIEKFNKLFVPFLIILLFLLPFLVKDTNLLSLNLYSNNDFNNNFNINFFILGLIYASYNSISLIPIAIKLKESNNISRKKSLYISLVFSCIISICGIILFILLESNKQFMKNEIPLLDIISNKKKYLKLLVQIAIAISIVSTAVSLQYAAILNIEKNKDNYLRDIIIMNIISIIVSRLGFQTLIKIFYPLFGLIGILNFIILMKNYFKYSKIKS